MIVPLLRPWLNRETRIPIFVLVIAKEATAVELLMHAHLDALQRGHGIFVPLIVTNCAAIG